MLTEHPDYCKIAEYYDRMYVRSETYLREVTKINSIIRKYKSSQGNELLDVACGTGSHAKLFSPTYKVTGIDLSENMLVMARKKVPSAEFISADMRDFSLEKEFDIILNLYGSVGYVEDLDQLYSVMRCAKQHLKQGGLYVVSPWSTTESFRQGLIVKSGKEMLSGFCRMETTTRIANNKVVVQMHHLISTDSKVTYNNYCQTLSLFSEQEYVNSIVAAGFRIVERLSCDEIRMGAFVCTY